MSTTPATAARNLYCYHHRAWEAWARGVPGTYGKYRMPAWDGGRDKSGRNHKPIWPRIAEVAAAGRMNLATLMEAAFHEPPNSRPRMPNTLVGEHGVAAYREYRERGASKARYRLEVSKQQLLLATVRTADLLAMSRGAAARLTLHDPDVQVSALFRYCAASMAGSEDAALFEVAAADELARGWCAITAGWRDFLPPEIKRRAAAIVATLGGEVERSS